MTDADRPLLRVVMVVCMIGAVLSIFLGGWIWHVRFHQPTTGHPTVIRSGPMRPERCHEPRPGHLICWYLEERSQ